MTVNRTEKVASVRPEGFRTVFFRPLAFRSALIICLAVLLSLWLSRTAPVHAAPARDSLPVLQLKKLTQVGLPEGASYLEGGTTAMTGYLATFLSSSASSPNPILLLDMNTWAVAKTASVQMSHANDMCFVPQRREIYVTPMDKAQIIVLDEETLTVKRTINVPQSYYAIGYDTKADRFAAAYVSGSGAGRHLTCDILDAECSKVLSSFSVDSNLTYQGLTVNDSLIYCAFWERGAVNSLYEPVYDGVFQKQDNVIYVYDFSGKLVKTLLITMPAGFTKFEIETVSFAGNRMILQFNEELDDTSKTKQFGIYEVTGEGSTLAQQEAEKTAAQKASTEKEETEKAANQFAATKVQITGAKGKKKLVRLEWSAASFGSKPVTGYEAQICRKKSFRGDSLDTVQAAANRCTFRGLTRKTTYYMRVRAYYRIGTQTYYSAWSAKKKVRTR